MPTLELDFEVFCAECGAGLCNNVQEGRTPKRGMPFIEVAPCEHCTKRLEDNAYQSGYSAGYDHGIEQAKP